MLTSKCFKPDHDNDSRYDSEEDQDKESDQCILESDNDNSFEESEILDDPLDQTALDDPVLTGDCFEFD